MSPNEFPRLVWPRGQSPKELRAKCILRAMREANQSHAVIFSCGNAAAALKAEAASYSERTDGRLVFHVLHVGRKGDMAPQRWFQPQEIALQWPGSFDATSGNLPVWLMLKIGARMRDVLGEQVVDGGQYDVPTGSGETILCLRWTFPKAKFRAVYGCEEGAKFEPGSPLNILVDTSGEVLHLPG